MQCVWVAGAMGVLAVTGGCEQTTPEAGRPADAARPLFVEVSEAAGLVFGHQTGATGHKWFPESYCAGVALFDFDNDGDLDVYFVQSGPLPHERGDQDPLPGNVLFENRGDGTFEDVTERAGVGDTHYGIGAACGDYDNDSDVDLYVLNFGPNVLYRNNGDGTFTEITAVARVGDPGNSASAAFVDYDADGRLDLFVVNYVDWTPEMNRAFPCNNRWGNPDFCSPNVYNAPAPDTLYHNNGDGTFRDVSEAAGIHAVYGNGMGVVATDLNGDGRVDLYVANDAMPNQLWINNGDGTFHDEALLAGCAVNNDGGAEAGMGVVAEDIDFDGDMDLFMVHLNNETNTLYRNDGGVFEDTTSRLGLDVTRPFTGFGTALFDYDHDGLLDIFVANGRVAQWQSRASDRNPYAEPDLLLHQTAGGTFVDVSARAGPYFQTALTGRGAAFGDLDNDGDVDIVVTNADGPARLLRNECLSRDRSGPDPDRHWLMVRAVGTRDNRDAIGARVSIVVGGRTRMREVRAAYSYASSNDLRVHFGLGATARVDDVVIRWPDGSRERFGPTESDRIVTVRQGEGTTVAQPGGAS